ncbi:MAG TPA: hypothetical protein ENH00_11845 [Actinobacteria bacterium]|nr:hypothetical protein [Actinomycetota bacterium]
MTTKANRTSAQVPPWAWFVIRFAVFGAAAVMPPPLILVALAIGWTVILAVEGRDGIPVAVLWTLVAVTINFVMLASLSGGEIG